MTDNNDDKTFGKKTLTLRPSGVNQGTVRQDMGRGRTKSVVVETVKRRPTRPLDEKPITPIAAPAARAPEAPAPQAPRPAPAQPSAPAARVHQPAPQPPRPQPPRQPDLALLHDFVGIEKQDDHGLPLLVNSCAEFAIVPAKRFFDLRQEFLAPSISGDYVACLGVSEVGAGSDVASLKTSARG